MIIDLTAERVARFRQACEELAAAIAAGAARSEIDRLQRLVVEARWPGLGDAIIAAEPCTTSRLSALFAVGVNRADSEAVSVVFGSDDMARLWGYRWSGHP